MASREATTDIKVKEIMSSPVITVKEDENVRKAALLMRKHGIGSVIVLDRKADPKGIITERDLLNRVTAKNLLPSKVNVKKIMSKPLITVTAETDITDAARKMKRTKIRRLPVVEGGKLCGVITTSDIAEITPALIDVLAEKSKIAPITSAREKRMLAGYCDKCSVWYENLKPDDGSYLCSDCIADRGEENKRS